MVRQYAVFNAVFLPLICGGRGDSRGNVPVMDEQPAARVALSMQVFAQAGRAATSPSMEPVWAATEATKARMTAWENCILKIWFFG